MQTMRRLLLLPLALLTLASVAHAQVGVSNLANTPLGYTYKGANTFVTQSFTTSANANPFQLTAVTVPIASGSGITDFTVQIRNNSGNIPGSLVGTLTGETSPTNGQYNFVNGSVLLDASTTYWVTWGFTAGAGDFGATQMAGYTSTGDWALGNSTTSYNNGANWYSPNPGYTFAISVQGVSAVPEPSTYAALVGAGVLGFALWRRRKAV